MTPTFSRPCFGLFPKVTNYVSLIFLIFLLSCTGGDPLKNFDTTSWLDDPKGCKGFREALITEHQDIQETLKGATSSYVTKKLGKPDQKEVEKRSRLFFRYFLYDSEKCNTEPQKKERFLQIRFNATGIVDEVIVY